MNDLNKTSSQPTNDIISLTVTEDELRKGLLLYPKNEKKIRVILSEQAWNCGSKNCITHSEPGKRCPKGNWICFRWCPPCIGHKIPDQPCDHKEGYAWHCGSSKCPTHPNPSEKCPDGNGKWFCGRHNPQCGGHDNNVEKCQIGVTTRLPNEAMMTREILFFIRSEAEKKSKCPLSVTTSDNFYVVLINRYLSDYLISPSEEKGREAIEKIGKKFSGPPDPRDNWEVRAVEVWNNQQIPAAFIALRKKLPNPFEAATDILSLANWNTLKIIDTEFMLGGPNLSREQDADVYEGGSNISNLFHWATGVKYCDTPPQDLREFFLSYELWHLEGWDGFEEDPINDLIAEEAGRIFGTMLINATVNYSNLIDSLNDSFIEARAWVGSLLRFRKDKFECFIVSPKITKCKDWWGVRGEFNAWAGNNIHEFFREGMLLEHMKNSDFVKRLIGVYTLIYEADRLPIQNSKLTEDLARGELDDVFEKIARGERISLSRGEEISRKYGER